MADHAISGVDRLIKRAADEAAESSPQDPSDDAVGEILRQALDRRARDASLVQRVGIAPDDLPDCSTALLEAGVESIGDCAYMGGEAALRRQACGKKGKHGQTERADGGAHAGRRPNDKR